MEIWQPDLWSKSDFNKVRITDVVFSFTYILYKCDFSFTDISVNATLIAIMMIIEFTNFFSWSYTAMHPILFYQHIILYYPSSDHSILSYIPCMIGANRGHEDEVSAAAPL